MEEVNIIKCTTCVHGEVCKYRKQYLDVLAAMRKTWREFVATDTPKQNSTTFSSAPFLLFKEPECEHYINRYRPNERSYERYEQPRELIENKEDQNG